MTPFLSSVAHHSPKRLLTASLLLCPGLAMAAALTPVTEDLAATGLVGLGSDRWCLLYRTQEALQILDGVACDRPQVGLVRRFD